MIVFASCNTPGQMEIDRDELVAAGVNPDDVEAVCQWVDKNKTFGDFGWADGDATFSCWGMGDDDE